jgi:hypothetical protein
VKQETLISVIISNIGANEEKAMNKNYLRVLSVGKQWLNFDGIQ